LKANAFIILDVDDCKSISCALFSETHETDVCIAEKRKFKGSSNPKLAKYHPSNPDSPDGQFSFLSLKEFQYTAKYFGSTVMAGGGFTLPLQSRSASVSHINERFIKVISVPFGVSTLKVRNVPGKSGSQEDLTGTLTAQLRKSNRN
jgi:hypothetical protein